VVVRRAVFYTMSLLLLLPLALFWGGCSEGDESSGWSSSELRWLTGEEKEKAIEIALSTSQSLSQLENTDVYEVEIDWMAEIQDDSGLHYWEFFEYEIVESGVPDDVPGSAIFYPCVHIVFGEPAQWLSQTAVALEAEKVVFLIGSPPRGITIDGS
jgi:hypothetical protein